MKKRIKYILPLFFVAVLLTNCAKDEEIHEVLSEPKTELNVSYGKNERHVMDVYLPAGRSQATTSVLVLIHGGGWYEGDKSSMNDFVAEFQSQMKDYAIVNINYRLVNFSNLYMLPTQTDDIRAAMDFVEDNASNWGVKPEFVVLGLSAGGHLAMLYSYKEDSGNRVKATVNIVGPSNLNDSFYTNNFIYNFAMGYIAKPEDLPADTKAAVFASPVTWITNSAPPTISFYGTTDSFIPESQHSALENALNDHKVPNEKHIYNGSHTEASYGQSADIVAKIKAFLAKHVR